MSADKTEQINPCISSQVDSNSSESSAEMDILKERTFLFSVLIEMLCSTLEEDEIKRKKLFKKLCKGIGKNSFQETEFKLDNLTETRKQAALKFLRHISSIQRSISPHSNEPRVDKMNTLIPISYVEKYEEAFQELKVIAHGGFGTVCMATHKVDGSTYAVKKIVFQYRNDSDYVKVMREVRNLARLSNTYVVAYNNAWVQPVVNQHDLNSDLYSESDNSDDKHALSMGSFDLSLDYSDAYFGKHRGSTVSESSSIIFRDDPNDTQIGFKSNVKETVSSDSSSIVFQKNSIDFQLSLNSDVNEKVSTYGESSSTSFQNKSKDAQSRKNAIQSKIVGSNNSKAGESPSNLPNLPISRIKMMLCIQMEYCDYDLRHWLNARNAGCNLPFSKSIPDIFKEILCGVAYIHEKEIIHRDLKPQNIFFSKEKGVMKVGDFGLATLSFTPSEDAQSSTCHSTNLGTLPYAAPEQRSSSVYDSKVDMYSLRIILIELLVITGTKSEFFTIIENFKKGLLPKEISLRWPDYIPLLKNLLQEDNTYRMKAKEVLNMTLFQDKTIEGTDLLEEMRNLEKSIVCQKEELLNRSKALDEREKEIKEQQRALEIEKEKFQEQLKMYNLLSPVKESL